MSTPSSFGINLNSSSYQPQDNKFAKVQDPRPNFLWCTEFAYGRGLEKGLIQQWSGIGGRINGHAGQWDDQAGSWGRQAKANSFVVWDPWQGGAASFGHVGFVERVNSDGSFTISEANVPDGSGTFNSRTIAPGTNAFNSAKFVYLSGGTTTTPAPTPTPTPTPTTNTKTGTEGPDRISGGSGNDTLSGLGGNDTMYGEAGNDLLLGGNGNDYLDGYASFQSSDFDTLTGGAGIDRFVLGNTNQGVFYRGNGQATITDYSWREDYIQLRGSSSDYQLSRQGSDTMVSLKNGDAIALIKNATDLSLTPRPGRVDFQFV